MRHIAVTATLTDDGGRTIQRRFDSEVIPDPHKACVEWVESRLKTEKADLEKAPRPVPYTNKRGSKDQAE